MGTQVMNLLVPALLVGAAGLSAVCLEIIGFTAVRSIHFIDSLRATRAASTRSNRKQ